MSKYIKQLTQVLLTVIAVTLAGCGGGGGGSSDSGNTNGTAVGAIQTPLWCQAPAVLNATGDGCVVNPCVYPQVDDGAGGCAMDLNAWIDGSNGITMPEPEYIPAANEVVLYYILEDENYDGWGLHAWNDAVCNSYSDFDADGGTSWTVPLAPTGIDTNFGAYWVMNVIDAPNCVNFIPHNLDTETQTTDLHATLTPIEQNPTNQFFVVEGWEAFLFPYPRTFASTIIPGGGALTCVAPQILNETGDACIDPAIDTFVPGEADLYLKGDFNAWENVDTYLFSYADNVYSMVTRLEPSVDAYNFKIADAAWSEATSFGATLTEEAVVLGEAKTLTVTEAENISISVSVAANYQFTFDATDPAAPVLTVIEVPLDKVMYVKGTMNEWSNTQAMVYVGEGVYTSEFTLAVAEYEFKVADADWTESTNFGAAQGDEALLLETPKNLVFGEDIAMNITLNITEAGNYTFSLDASVPDVPVLTVVNAIPFGSATLYLKGEMNEWGGNLEGFDFTYADNNYTLITTVPAGLHQFKIADADWNDAATLGAVAGDEAIVAGEAKTLTLLDEANLTFEFAADTLYRINVDATDKNAPVLSVDVHVPFAGRTMYLKGEMNGWGGELEGYAFTYAASGIFTLDTTLAAGPYNFKIADVDWADDSTVGAATDDGTVVLGEGKTLVLPGDDNLFIEVSEEKSFHFTLDASIPSAPVLTVE